MRAGGSWRLLRWIAVLLAFLALYLPLVLIATRSFQSSESGLAGGGAWTLDWYRKVFSDAEVLRALETSLLIGAFSTAIATLVGTAGALAIGRSRFRGTRAIQALNSVNLAMPEIVLGLSLLIWFVFLGVTLGTFSVILAHATYSISYVMITVGARMEGLDPSLEEAARDLGATPLQAFFKVTFPLLLPGIASGALMAFTLSFDDFLIAYFTSGAGAETLPLRIYSMVRFGMSPEIHALSTLLVAVTLVTVSLAFGARGVRSFLAAETRQAE